jgi:phosphoribosyl 1,2-cyclic phosphodiesterase
MRLEFWGTRGSVPTPGRDTAGYGGNTSCVAVATDLADHLVILDAGSGIRLLGEELPDGLSRIDVLLTHLHMDHIIGLGFFGALYRTDLEVHIWGPSSTTRDLRARLARYLSPPLFPVRLSDLPSEPVLHDVPLGDFEVPGLGVRAALVCHPGPTVGYRLDDGRSTVAYLPDHEPALGAHTFPDAPGWTSGYDLASGVDVLIHDAQYEDSEYGEHVGWGHSAIGDTFRFAALAGVGHLVPFHHDPSHDDRTLDAIYARDEVAEQPFGVTPARERATLEVPRATRWERAHAATG